MALGECEHIEVGRLTRTMYFEISSQPQLGLADPSKFTFMLQVKGRRLATRAWAGHDHAWVPSVP